jgi:hypothetical protein
MSGCVAFWNNARQSEYEDASGQDAQAASTVADDTGAALVRKRVMSMIKNMVVSTNRGGVNQLERLEFW